MISEYPLTKAHRIRLAQVFRDVPRVDISIECAVEGQMGKAYVDGLENPTAFQIQIGPFHYFAGNVKNGRDMLQNFPPYNLLMPSSSGWVDACKEMYGERLIAFDRYSFTTERLSLEHLQGLCQRPQFPFHVKRMDVSLLERIKGQDHFIDVSDFDSPADFVERGIGFYVEKDGEILGAAYSSLVCSTGIEVSLFVVEDYRQQGMATILSANLIRWCLEHNMDAHWDAANLESCKLAEKLGYTPAGTYQAYYLKEK